MRVNLKKNNYWYKFVWCNLKKDVPKKYQCELIKKKIVIGTNLSRVI